MANAAPAGGLDLASGLAAQSVERLTEALGELLRRAADSGGIRGDIAPEDLLRAAIGMGCAQERPGWQEGVARLTDVFVDGLSGPPAPADACRAGRGGRG